MQPACGRFSKWNSFAIEFSIISSTFYLMETALNRQEMDIEHLIH
ncbi:hypothetical protein T01_1085 [Trichinella spiralis]|uniref:Uncharacterized protein n=1 Tax=Trichinella spiralis TaxID=6334 RepID=A0A0V0Z3Z1_TRISP|nr:hypothetical protein T01_1085 [Trichinella spiralis]